MRRARGDARRAWAVERSGVERDGGATLLEGAVVVEIPAQREGSVVVALAATVVDNRAAAAAVRRVEGDALDVVVVVVVGAGLPRRRGGHRPRRDGARGRTVDTQRVEVVDFLELPGAAKDDRVGPRELVAADRVVVGLDVAAGRCEPSDRADPVPERIGEDVAA